MRCILCGSKGVFRGFKMAETCPRCELKFEREQGQFVGAVGMNTIFSFGSILIALVVSFVIAMPEPNPVQVLVPVLLVAIIAPVALFNVSKGLWGAFDLIMEPLREDEATPGPWVSDEPIYMDD